MTVLESGRPRVCVIGAGVGSLIAIELGRRGCDVVLVDERPAILGGASDAQLGRLHLGHHYSGDDRFAPGRLNTAQRCTLGALAWVRRYPEAAPRAGRWWQLITSDSMTPPAEYLAFCDHLAAFQGRLAATDPVARELLGPPARAVRPLGEHEYAGHVAPDRVVLGVETRERVIDLRGLRDAIGRDLRATPRVEVRLATRVESVRSTAGGFAVRLATGEELPADLVVNCGWHDRGDQEGHGGPRLTTRMTTRLRFVVTADLPPSLRDAPSMFFHRGVLGNHTRLDDRTIRFVSEPVCNFRTVPGGVVPEAWRRLLVEPGDPRRWVDGIGAALALPVRAAPTPAAARPLHTLTEALVEALRRGGPDAGWVVHDHLAAAVVAGYGALVPGVRDARHVRVTPTASVELGHSDVWAPEGAVHRRDWATLVDRRGIVTVHPGKFTFGVLAAEDAADRALALLGRRADRPFDAVAEATSGS